MKYLCSLGGDTTKDTVEHMLNRIFATLLARNYKSNWARRSSKIGIIYSNLARVIKEICIYNNMEFMWKKIS